MFFKKIVVLFFISFLGCTGAQDIPSKISVIDYSELDHHKLKIEKEDQKALKDYYLLIKQADTILKIPFFSVVHKTGIPPSGNKHDYMSIGPYWWPNPKTELPYIRKDGEINPETRDNFTDFLETTNFFSAIKVLTKIYYYSNQQKIC